MTDSDEIYLVDGSGFIFRAYYALAYSGQGGLTNPEGTPVSAVYGFTNMLIKLLKDYHAPAIAVIFDAARENFRNDIYPEYKANRDETPEDLKPQFPLIRKAVEAFDIPSLELEGYEADDLIAAYTKIAKAQGKKVVIVSSDKDLMQLVDDNVRMLDAMKGKWIGPQEVVEKFGVTPDKVVDVQALAGDSVDNIPGVPGIGVKTAAQLINEFGSLEELLSRAAEIPQKGRREKMLANIEEARISQKLVRLDENAPVPVPLEDLKVRDQDHPELVPFLQEQGFNSIIKRVGRASDIVAKTTDNQGAQGDQSGNAAPPAALAQQNQDFPAISGNEYILINDEKTLEEWISGARKAGLLAIDTETTSLTPAKADLVGISMAYEIGKAAYIPLSHKAAQADLLGDGGGDDTPQLPIDKVVGALKPLLEDPAVMKIGHNMKYDWQILAAYGIETTPCDDTMLMSYVLDGTSLGNSMDKISARLFGHDPIKYEDVAGKGKSQVTFDHVDISKALDYAAEDAEITLRIYHTLKPRLAAEKMVSVYENIERPLIPVIAKMEMQGIKVDPAFLNDLSARFAGQIAALEREIHELAGQPFNIASPKQVGEILFDVMGLEGGKKTKSGQYSTDVSTLEKLAAEGHEIVEKILEHRQLSKLKSTYSDALVEDINPKTGRVHTSFSMAGTSTGRLASSDPNLQNIPIRTAEGREIRKAFIPENGCVLLSVDYSQVELRLAAEMAGVKALQQAFKDGTDIHAMTASQVFGVKLEDVDAELRRRAKAVNFGIIYGISGWGLAKQLGCPPGDANDFINAYLNVFSEIRDYMEETKEAARKNEYVRTLYGRKCFTPSINDKNGARRSGAERAAINAPLQGTAADIMKLAMAQMPRALEQAGLKAKMLLQVHDELIFEVPEDELESASDLVRGVMENAWKQKGVQISVPLIAEAGSGENWDAAH